MNNLPTEIHLQILPFLDYHSQINLRACNRYYRSLPQLSQKDQFSLLFAMERLSEERWLTLKRTTIDFLPCYHCLRIRPQRAYYNYLPLYRSLRILDGEYQLYTTFRMCPECKIEHDATLFLGGASCVADYPALGGSVPW